MKNRWKITGVLLITTGIGYLALETPVIVHRGYIQEATGSRRGHTSLIGLFDINHWQETTDLELFANDNGLSYNEEWTSYLGDHNNLFGMTLKRAHGRPSNPLKPEMINEYCALMTDEEKVRLLEIFSSKDQEAIQAEIERFADFAESSIIRPQKGPPQ